MCSHPLPSAMCRESVAAEESAGQNRKRLVYVCPFLIANSQAAELVPPNECRLHYPAPAPQPAPCSVLRIARTGTMTAFTQTLADDLATNIIHESAHMSQVL